MLLLVDALLWTNSSYMKDRKMWLSKCPIQELLETYISLSYITCLRYKAEKESSTNLNYNVSRSEAFFPLFDGIFSPYFLVITPNKNTNHNRMSKYSVCNI